jgi:hypothetical protein
MASKGIINAGANSEEVITWFHHVLVALSLVQSSSNVVILDVTKDVLPLKTATDTLAKCTVHPSCSVERRVTSLSHTVMPVTPVASCKITWRRCGGPSCGGYTWTSMADRRNLAPTLCDLPLIAPHVNVAGVMDAMKASRLVRLGGVIGADMGLGIVSVGAAESEASVMGLGKVGVGAAESEAARLAPAPGILMSV